MRGTRTVCVAALLAVAVLLPQVASAVPVTILGSVTITGEGGAPLAPGSLVGVALIANPGLEKSISQPVPPYTFPVFVDGEASAPGGQKPPKLLTKNLDTTVAVTNTTGAPLAIEVTLRDASGAVLAGPVSMVVPANGTTVIVVSDLLS